MLKNLVVWKPSTFDWDLQSRIEESILRKIIQEAITLTEPLGLHGQPNSCPMRHMNSHNQCDYYRPQMGPSLTFAGPGSKI